MLGAAMASYTQTVTVVDEQSGAPLELVTITSETPRVMVFTNHRGQADLVAFTTSTKIVIRSLGYRSLTTSFELLQENQFIVRLKPTMVQFDAVVVSASKWSQSVAQLPTRVASISPKEVALLNPQTAADLLGATGEVFIQKSQQGGGSPMIRGFAANRLVYAVDGVRMNTAIFRGGNLQNVISLDAFAIEGTEVLFGPGSVIYGSDAIGGVMSFRTLSPQLSLNDEPIVSGNAVMRHSSANNELTNHVHINVGWRKWASVTSFTHSQFGDLRMGRHGPDEYLKRHYLMRVDSVDRIVENPDPLVQNPTGYSQFNVMQKLRFKPNDHLDVQYGFHYSETSEFARYDRLIEFRPDGNPRSAVWNYGPQIWMMNNLSMHYAKANALFDEVNLRLAQQFFEESRIDRNFSGGQRFRLRNQLEEVNAYSANLDFHKVAAKHVLNYGVELVLNQVTSTATATDIRDGSPIPVADRYPLSEWGSAGAYLTYQYLASDQFSVHTGVRYNGFSLASDFTRHLDFFPFDFTEAQLNNQSVTGSLGVVFSPDPSWKVSANGATGFRAPNVDDIGKIFDFGVNEVVLPNPQLQAEYAYNAELSVVKVVKETVKIEVTGFYTYLDNALVRRPFAVNGQDSILFDGELSQVFAVQNAAFGTVYGFNAGIEVDLPGGFGLSARYNYQRGDEELDTGELSRSRHAAPAFGSAGVSFKRNKLRMQVYAMFSAEVSHENLNFEERLKTFIYAADENGLPYSPSWCILNFKMLHQLNPNWSVSGGVENITDQRYRPYSAGLVAPGRNVVVSLKTVF